MVPEGAVSYLGVYIAVIKLRDFGSKAYFKPKVPHHSPSSKELEARHLEAGTDAETVEDAAPRLAPVTCSTCFLYSTRDHLAWGGTAPKCAGSFHISHQSGKCTTRLSG